jgi:RimJ/RimL family protein N-acetyltransferase
MHIPVSEILYLRPFAWGDEHDLVDMLNHQETYNNTLLLPYPFTLEEAVFRLQREENAKREIPIWYALCTKGDEKAIASLSVMPEGSFMRPHLAEIGYCINPAYSGRGYTTLAVKVFSEFVFKTFPYDKLIANTFVGNEASAKVAMKAGYREEGLLRGHYKKNGQFIDARTFGLLKDEIQTNG